ncbi:MAG: type III secretion HpaP family protein [Puniceicoccales bacterium]|jgi:hypothetical protein|nr:type III secretion HpaP family protein [Puniceicoccales bacterium]
MTDKIKHQSMEKGSRDSLENDAFSKKEIAELSNEAMQKADPRDVSSFAEKLMKDTNIKNGNGSEDLRFGGGEHNRPGTFSKSDQNQRDSFAGLQKTGDFPRADQNQRNSRDSFVGFQKMGNSQGTGDSQRADQNQRDSFAGPQKTGDSQRTGDFPRADQNQSDSRDSFVGSQKTGVVGTRGMNPNAQAIESTKSQRQGSLRDMKDVDLRDPAEIKDTSAISGAKILDNLQLQHIDPAANESAQAIKSIAVQVAEKIIATNEALNAKQEVRITLQDGILKDTDVSISKEGKSLSVVFFSGASDSVNFLRENSDSLMRQLQNNLRDINHVEIEIEQQSASDNQNNDGRSRNRFGNQQQQEDEKDSQ